MIPRAMIAITYIVLALPVTLFMATWYVPWVGIPAAGVLVWSMRYVLRLKTEPAASLTRASWIIVIATSVLWLVINGAGGIGWQQADWLKHNVMLADLIKQPWPVLYTPEKPLVYYVAYYLGPAAAGKLGGWFVAYGILGIQTWGLYFLAACWVVKLLGRNGAIGLILFSLFSGLDAVGGWITERPFDPWWSRLQYSNPALLVMFVPQHVSIGWLGAALVWEGDRQGHPELGVLTWLLSPCWSPFVTLGLAPFVLFTWLRHRGWRHAFSLQVVAGLIVFVPAIAFFQSRAPLESYTWHEMNVSDGIFVLFMTLQWGLYAALLALVEGRRLLRRPFLLIAFLSLAVIPFVPFSGYTDFVMRASIPALFFLALQVIESALEGVRRRNLAVAALWVTMLVGALQPLFHLRQSLVRFELNIPPIEQIPSLDQLAAYTGHSGDGRQYIGRIDTVYFQHLAARHRS